MTASSVAPCYDLESIIREYEKGCKLLKRNKEKLVDRVSTLFDEAVNGEKQKVLLEKKFSDLKARLEEFYSLEESQSELIKKRVFHRVSALRNEFKLERRNCSAVEDLLQAETALDSVAADVIGEDQEESTTELCHALHFGEGTGTETAMKKELEDLEKQLSLKEDKLTQLHKHLNAVSNEMNQMWPSEISVETKNAVLDGLRKRNRVIGLKLLQLRLERTKLDAQTLING
uniref:NAB domain-containing protein n=1 Tax=Syphacia muris TaxID=451379 RepID=A0A0N5AAW1_9BILA